ncbi:MAG: phospholipase D-like domain-containing protein [Candidatus Eremiobacteraeota bacterium]|nr:phospholipase D-like domain-containing protein [Candidatus Eremiobacteraeota bacterium]
MKINDTRFVHLVADQGVIKDKEKKLEKENEEPQADAYESGEGKPALMDPEKMLSLVKQKTFNLGDVKDTVEELKQARGFRASEEELKAIRRELKELHGEITSTEWKNIAPSDRKRLEWISLAEAGVKDSLEGIRKNHRTTQWEQIAAGQGGEIPATYEHYFRETQVPAGEMREILKLAGDLNSPGSAMKLQGNETTPLMRGDIWARKMSLLDRAVKEPVQEGKPVEIDAEYYEMSSPAMIGRLTCAAQAGAKVRVVLDPGHLQGTGKKSFDGTSLAVRASTVEQLLRDNEERDMAVTLYPNREQLGGRDEIMHRKIFRVGEEVVFGGMNANEGSGENIDFGMAIRGPAAKKLGEEFREDAATSAGKSLEDIYGNQLELLRDEETSVSLSKFGFESMLSSFYGSRAGLTEAESRSGRVEKLLAAAKQGGIKPAMLGEFPDTDGDGRVSTIDVRDFLVSGGGKSVKLTEAGKELLASSVESTVARISKKKNVAAFSDSAPPEGTVEDGARAKDVLAVGSSGVERQALVLNSIASAEKFIKVSAFVLNDDMAKLLIEKKREKEARGEKFQVQVIMDPGLYGYGGTPNEAAYKRLEDGGVEVKWSLLDRTSPAHDRKNHSKLIITDKMILTGSTNFSAKGLRNNWEVNDIVYFNEDDPGSMEKQAEVVRDYDAMWKREAIGINTKIPAARRYEDYQGDDREQKTDRYRTKLVREFCESIEEYEKEIGAKISAASSDKGIRERVAGRVAGGEDSGYAILKCFTAQELDSMRASLPSWRNLQNLRAGREPQG